MLCQQTLPFESDPFLSSKTSCFPLWALFHIGKIPVKTSLRFIPLLWKKFATAHTWAPPHVLFLDGPKSLRCKALRKMDLCWLFWTFELCQHHLTVKPFHAKLISKYTSWPTMQCMQNLSFFSIILFHSRFNMAIIEIIMEATDFYLQVGSWSLSEKACHAFLFNAVCKRGYD